MSRTFILHSPLGDDQLKFVHLSGKEALSDISEFDLQCVSQSDEIDASAVLGHSITIEVITQDGSSRYINGIVSHFAYIGPEGSAGRRYLYEAKIHSWLWLTDKRADCRIYQEKDVPTIIREALQEFGMPFEIKTMDVYEQRPYTVQFQETTLNFVKRLAEEVGLYFYVRHELGLHTIVFTDGSHSTLPEYASIPFLTPGLKTLTAEEYVTEWKVQHAVRSGNYTTTSYNFKAPGANLQQNDGVRKGHGHDTLEMFEWSGAYVDREDGAKRARVRAEQQQLDYKTITANSNVRGIAPGFYFKLTDHPNRSNNAEYLIISANYHFQENADSTGSHGEVTNWNVSFTAKPSMERYQPPRVTVKPRIIGPQSALVTGPAGEETWTNELGMVKVYFYWDRYSSRDENSSCWIRVASSWAGANWGEIMVPRIGQEVIVEHLDGDADRPIIVASVNNANQMPSTFSKTGGLPTNQALAGIKSREFQGNRYNQLLFDDTSGEIRAQLESEHAKSQLNLGYLSHPRNGSAAPRGEGFDLRTDAWGSLRAARGLLISAEAQTGGQGNALSRDELSALLQEALHVAKSLGEFAAKNLGNASDPKPQATLSKAVTDLGNGSNAEKGENGGTPIVAITSPEGIALGTPKSTTIATGEHLDLTSMQNQQFSAGKTMNLHATESISLFAVKKGIKSIAHKGDNIMQAHAGDIQINADKTVTITSSHEDVMIAADKHITLMCGGASITLAGGNIQIHCPGTLDLKAGNYSMLGPESLGPDLPALPQTPPYDEQFVVRDKHTGKPIPYVAYHIFTDDGETIHGVTNENGETERIMSDKSKQLKIYIDA